MHHGLLLNPKESDHWEVGSGLATERFGGVGLNPTGDWTPWRPPDEAQSRSGFDTDGCAVFGTLKAWIVLAKFYGFTDFPQDLSERYTGVMAGTTLTGTDPHVVAEVTRTTAGAVPQAVMPWTEDIDTYDEYYNKPMAQSLLPFGKELLNKFELGHEWVFPWGSTYTPEQKATLLTTALKRGTVCVSVDGNYEEDAQGNLTKPVGAQDSHWVLLLNQNTIDDQYIPFVKTLAENYDHNSAKLYFMKRNTQASQNFWSGVWNNFANLWKPS